MKSLFSSALSLAILALGLLPVTATPLDDRIAELKHAIQKEAAAKAANAAGPQGGFQNPGLSPAFIAANVDQIIAQMQNPAYGANSDAQLAQITSMFTSDEVQEATTNLLAEIHKERKDRLDAETASVKALIARAATQINQAKKPEDLDDLITEMGKHAGNRYGGGGAQGDQELAQQFSGTYEFAKQWQNYLAHLVNGQTDLARNDLQSLSQNNYAVDIIPRSKLLELASPGNLAAAPVKGPVSTAPTPASQAQVILDGIKTLDDIPAALAKLEPLRQNNVGDVQNAYNNLSQMLQTYQNLKAGVPAQVNMNFGYGNGPSVPAELRAQLLVLTLQLRFNTFQGKPPPPSEKPADFVDRVIGDAMARQDWDLLRSATQARSSLVQNTGFGYPVPYTPGIDNLIAASHQETAGQFALAVQSYESALKSNDPAVPAKIIGDKLATIQHDHPTEFADGMQLVTAPPVPHLYQGALPPGFPAPSNYPSAQVPPTLLSPAASTNAAPPAK